MDYFTPFDEQGLDEKLRGNPTEFLAISFSSDWRFAAPHSQRIVDELKARQLNASHTEIESPWGHDSFLLDVPEYHDALAQFLQRDAS